MMQVTGLLLIQPKVGGPTILRFFGTVRRLKIKPKIIEKQPYKVEGLADL
jgi:hypothetical protein